jgi:hypothetical protein
MHNLLKIALVGKALLVLTACDKEVTPPTNLTCKRMTFAVKIVGYGYTPEQAMRAAREAAEADFPDGVEESIYPPVYRINYWEREPICQPKPEPLKPSELRKIREKLRPER